MLLHPIKHVWSRFGLDPPAPVVEAGTLTSSAAIRIICRQTPRCCCAARTWDRVGSAMSHRGSFRADRACMQTKNVKHATPLLQQHAHVCSARGWRPHTLAQTCRPRVQNLRVEQVAEVYLHRMGVEATCPLLQIKKKLVHIKGVETTHLSTNM